MRTVWLHRAGRSYRGVALLKVPVRSARVHLLRDDRRAPTGMRVQCDASRGKGATVSQASVWAKAKQRRYRSIGRALQRARRSCGLRLEDVAERTGRSASYCSQLENGYYAPSIDTLRSFAKVCGELTLSQLLDGAS